jgi:hypothetical protein
LVADRFHAGFAGEGSEADFALPRDAQVPFAIAALGARVTVAAWKTKSSWYVVAMEDGAVAPPHEAIKVQFGSKDMLPSKSAGAVRTLREDDG